MKRLLLCLLAVAALCACAECFFVELPADGSAAEIRPGGKIVWADAVSTNSAYTPSVSLVREAWTTAAAVTPHAWTNFTYSVSWTNTVWSGTNATVVAHTNTAVRPYERFPATMTGYWTNATVRTWATTNWVPALVCAETNAVTPGTSYAAPGDKLKLSSAAPAGARVTVGIEH